MHVAAILAATALSIPSGDFFSIDSRVEKLEARVEKLEARVAALEKALSDAGKPKQNAKPVVVRIGMQPNCIPCMKAKALAENLGAVVQEYHETRQATPVITIGGETVIGYDAGWITRKISEQKQE